MVQRTINDMYVTSCSNSMIQTRFKYQRFGAQNKNVCHEHHMQKRPDLGEAALAVLATAAIQKPKSYPMEISALQPSSAEQQLRPMYQNALA